MEPQTTKKGVLIKCNLETQTRVLFAWDGKTQNDGGSDRAGFVSEPACVSMENLWFVCWSEVGWGWQLAAETVHILARFP